MADDKRKEAEDSSPSASVTPTINAAAEPTAWNNESDALPTYGELSQEPKSDASNTIINTKQASLPSSGKGKDGKEQGPPEYYSSEGWGNEENNDHFTASEFLRAVVFENQRWYPLVGWESTGPLDPRNFSNGTGTRGSGAKPKLTTGKMWQIDRSGYPDLCDLEGWTYAGGFDEIRDKSAMGHGNEKKDMVLVRRRRWVSPVPTTLLQHAKYRDIPGKSTDAVDDDDLVWDLLETEVVNPNNDTERTLTAHLKPSSIVRRGFATVEADFLREKGNMWLALEEKEFRIYADRREPAPVKVYSMRRVSDINFKKFADPCGIVLTFNGYDRNKRVALRFSDATECEKWYNDLSNVRAALRNWDIAKGVGIVLAGVLLSGAARRK
eukprot:CFRG0950T1